jgi:hypothetical protein
MKRSGTLQITGSEQGCCTATWIPTGAPEADLRQRTLVDGADLEDFLCALGIDEDLITNAIRALHDAPGAQPSHAISEVWLSEEEAKQHGLA